jgi:hypothetical protein
VVKSGEKKGAVYFKCGKCRVLYYVQLPPCPECGAAMIQGSRDGRKFWTCRDKCAKSLRFVKGRIIKF